MSYTIDSRSSELRRWKAQFAVDQTRNLIERVEELTVRVHELEQSRDEQQMDNLSWDE